ASVARSGGQGPPPASAPRPATPGLTRRVRGAQMPTTEPMALRRTDPPARSAGAPSASPVVPPLAPAGPATDPALRDAPPGEPRAAEDVYRFLADFTAGVQRGVEATRPNDRR